MKRFFLFLLATLLAAALILPAGACAETSLGVDFAAMTDEELSAVIAAAQAELDARKAPRDAAPDGALVIREGEELPLIDEMGLSIKLTGGINAYGDDTWFLELENIGENNTDETMSASVVDAYANGWDINVIGFGEIAAGKKKRDNVMFVLSGDDIKDVSEIETLEMKVRIYKNSQFTGVEKNMTLTFG